MSTGVPPSIYNAGAFWSELQAAVDSWILKGLRVASQVNISRRKVVLGEAVVNAAADDRVSFSFAPLEGHGLSQVTINNALALRFAAHRMHQDTDSIGNVSALFLSLVTEDPAMLLKESICAHLSGRRYEFEKGLGVDLELSRADLFPAMRYIQVTIDCTLPETQGQVDLLFDLNALKKYVAGHASNFSQNINSSKLDEHGVIGNSVHQSNVPVHAILERIQMSFGECSRFKVGQTLPLLKANKDEVMLAVDTISGSTDISKGQLGLWKRKRAIKLHLPISESFVRDLVGF